MEAGCLYRAVSWLRLHNWARFPPASEILQTQRSGVPQTKSCGLPAKRGGSQAGTDGMRFRRSGSHRSKEARRLCRSAYRTNSDGRFQKETRSLALPMPDSRRTSRREHGGAGAPDGGQAGRRKRSAVRKPLSVCGLRHLCFSAVRKPPASFRQRRKSWQLRGRSHATAPPSENPLHHSVLRGQNTYGRLPPAAAQTPSRERVRRDGRRGRKPVRSAEIPAFPRFPLFIPSPPARNAQSDEKRS